MFNAMCLSIDGSELAKAPFWKQLKMLSLSHCHNVHPVLEKLAGSPALEVLDVSTTDLKASDYALIGQMTNLTSLNLTRNKITAADLQALSKLRQLRHLAVVYSRMDGAEFVEAAKRLPSLTLLTVLKGQIKDKDLSALRAAKPGLRILQMTSEQFQELTNQAAGKW
jgi:Leucine-rich repeat (LRR) protein